MNITLDRIKNIAEDIIADDEWVNDSHTQAEHSGVKAGLYALIHHLEETQGKDFKKTCIQYGGTNCDIHDKKKIMR